jgi:hypothetical protein
MIKGSIEDFWGNWAFNVDGFDGEWSLKGCLSLFFLLVFVFLLLSMFSSAISAWTWRPPRWIQENPSLNLRTIQSLTTLSSHLPSGTYHDTLQDLSELPAIFSVKFRAPTTSELLTITLVGKQIEHNTKTR